MYHQVIRNADVSGDHNQWQVRAESCPRANGAARSLTISSTKCRPFCPRKNRGENPPDFSLLIFKPSHNKTSPLNLPLTKTDKSHLPGDRSRFQCIQKRTLKPPPKKTIQEISNRTHWRDPFSPEYQIAWSQLRGSVGIRVLETRTKLARAGSRKTSEEKHVRSFWEKQINLWIKSTMIIRDICHLVMSHKNHSHVQSFQITTTGSLFC